MFDNNLINVIFTAEMLINIQMYSEKFPESIFSGKFIKTGNINEARPKPT